MLKINTEAYRSGHNGTDSKSVEPSGFRGFESHRFRQKTIGIPQSLRNALFFMCVQKRPVFYLLTIDDGSRLLHPEESLASGR